MSWYRPQATEITPESAGWGFTGLRIVRDNHAGTTGQNEMVVVPLAGSCTVGCQPAKIELTGRPNVFAGVTDCAYLPPDTEYTITGTGRFALATARAAGKLPVRYIAADQVRVEHRGAGVCARQVNNFGTPDVLDADRLIACEVLTPAGNWSSYPPHKHDNERTGESVLEEIYYFEVADGPAGPGMGYLKAAEVLAEVRTGDVVLVPYGYHGPAMAVPGYDMYYLNVMAGPGKREWLICEDPAHSWIRETWR
ncbi:MAG: 5-deoxy-glucuronate isomerase [Streptosporangiaceae bacterium]|nr:5-deoxy-glucuronate isomerase [Streptosporangiaceae bacterium]